METEERRTLIAHEVLVAFNSRSVSGRVVVNPPQKMAPLKLRSTTDRVQFCCGRAFLTEASFEKHQTESEEHGKPVDLANIRSALNPRSSRDFWAARKRRSAKKFDEEGEEIEIEQNGEDENVDEDDQDQNKYQEHGLRYQEQDARAEEDYEQYDDEGEGFPVEPMMEMDHENENGDEDQDQEQEQEFQDMPRLKRQAGKRRRKSPKKRTKKRGTVTCDLCSLSIPGTNYTRHMRTCHNPSHENVCSFCSCRFLLPYGRLLHQAKVHGVSTPTKVKSGSSNLTTAALKVKKKLISVNIKPKPRLNSLANVVNTKSALQIANAIRPNSSEENQIANDYKSNVIKLPVGGYQCRICQKTFQGSSNAKDHLNTHSKLKPYACPLCSYTFSFRSNVARHIRTCHAENSDFICPYGCGCSMQTQTSLTVHVNLICTLRDKFKLPKAKTNSQRKVVAVAVKEEYYEENENQNHNADTDNYEEFESQDGQGQSGNWDEEYQYQYEYEHEQSSSQPQEQTQVPAPVPRLSEQFKDACVGAQMYYCKTCDKNITGVGNYRDHLNIHAGIRPFKCPLCDMRFTFKSNIKRHVSQCHIEGGEFPCPQNCGCVMGNTGALNSHLNKCRRVQLGLDDKPHPGPIVVKKNLSSRPGSGASPGQRMIIKQAPMSANGSPGSGQSQFLPRPPPLTPSPFLHHNHNQVKTNKDKKPLVNVNVKFPPDPSKPFKCHLCGKSVANKRNLRNHIRTHSGLKPYKCQICHLLFTARESLSKHERKSHAPDAKYRCSRCPCQFQQNQGLAMHIRLHHTKQVSKMGMFQQPQKFSSGIVGKTVVSVLLPNQLQEEKLENCIMASGKFKCKLCGKLLQTRNSFRNHLLIHSGAKPFMCEFCGASFRLYSTMYDHKKSSHSGGQFKCDSCTCSFQNELGLRRHQTIFHGKRSMNYIQKKARNIRRKAALTLNVRGIKQEVQEQATLVAISPQKSNSILKNRLTSLTTTNSPSRSTSTMPSSSMSPNKAMQNCAQNSSSSSRSNNMFQCGHCGIALASLFDLSEHQKEHAVPVAVNKPISAISINQKPAPARAQSKELVKLGFDLRAIAKGLQPHPKTCPLCHRLMRKRDHFVQHIKSCHSGGEFNCALCACQFVTSGSLSRHYRQTHPNASEKEKSAKSVSYTSASVSNSNGNIGNVTATSSIQHQAATGIQQTGMAKNLNPKTLKPPQIITKAFYKCQYCEKIFDQSWVYNQHVLIHTNIKPHECTQCGQKFRTTGILAQHVKTSHGSGNYRCNSCPCVFQTEKGLSVHRFVYHKGGRDGLKGGAKNKSLNGPSASTSTSSSVASVAPRPQRYSQPSSTSSTFDTAVHKLSPKTRPIKCQLCEKSCLGPGSLSLHMKTHHNVGHTYEPSIEMQESPTHTRQNLNKTYPSASQRKMPQLRHAPTSTSSSIYRHQNQTQHNVANDMAEEDEDANFEIVGYENYNADGYGYEEEQALEDSYEQQQENGDGVGDYYQEFQNGDYELDIVHENYTYGDQDQDQDMYEQNEQAEDGIEIEMDNDDPRDHIRNYEHQEVSVDELSQPIKCRACLVSFTTRDSFAFHIESGSTNEDTFRCPYCCTSGVTIENLSTHMDEFHPMDEIEFLESQIYADS